LGIDLVTDAVLVADPDLAMSRPGAAGKFFDAEIESR